MTNAKPGPKPKPRPEPIGGRRRLMHLWCTVCGQENVVQTWLEPHQGDGWPKHKCYTKTDRGAIHARVAPFTDGRPQATDGMSELEKDHPYIQPGL